MTNPFSRRLLACLLVGLLVLIVGCQPSSVGSSSSPSAAAGTPTIVAFATFGGPEELAAYEALITAFEAATPTVNIELRHIPSQGDYRRQLAASFAAGTPADVMIIDYPRIAAFAAQGGLEPVGPYLDREGTPDASKFYPQSLDAYRYNGQLWCIPQNVSSLVVYYNRSLFEAAGIPLPDTGWTQEAFLEAARALTKDENGDGTPEQYGVGVDAELRRLVPFIWQAGGDIVDNPAAPTRLTLDAPEALAALRWFTALQTEEHVTPDRAAASAEDIESRFLNGHEAMYLASRRAVPTLRTITDFEWDVAPLPQGEQAGTVLHSDGFCMAAASKNKEAAWQFVAFANSAVGQAILAETGRTVPSRPDVAESAAFLRTDAPPAHSRVFLDVIPTIRGVPLLPEWPDIEETANGEIERAFYGDISADEAAKNAVEATLPLFAK